ncbi:hypothetical protein [Candidatus Schmidhempelia bombi]|uniref:YobI-like P-loop NTPase domain-containing protein n=1 Tax=Candidatus Schmidhempelia bombi str. Bimp TaxID=1387197 RepID=A0AB94IB35_9GAMM|nr:hypothetical protein [Candidatus Schmidhempelia bombi]TEA26617.1 hypothetical protein O970_08000 [Candidatus Schmidhempelia bombi str. Bimp]
MEHSQNEAEALEQNATFEKLTPTFLSDDEMQGYRQALDFVFQENDLLNIAIAGPYASGKSSVIKTYEEKIKHLNGIHISLSYFSPTLESKIKGKNKSDELIFEDELILERKIINQLVHQIDPAKIPATEFKVKNETPKWDKIIWSGTFTVILFFLIFIDKNQLTNWYSEQNYIASSLFLLFFCSFVYFIFYKIVDLQSRNNLIRNLKIFENEIDISSSECDVSYFDKYLNEIIYILNQSKLDYIIFEDIDRYDDNLILNKLRELNYTYNKKQSKNKPKPIKFIYLIKDEIFESKERAKFFDYILPIVPVMDNSNSLGKMVQIFKKQNIYSDFTSTFLDNLSYYLDDIRLIKNICNEYIIYKTKLAHNAGWFRHEKLLAIIVYKNIFPADFSLTRLGLGQGVVHRIIESLKMQKSETVQNRIKKIDNDIELLKNKISIIEDCHLKNLDELGALYISFDNQIDFKYYRYIGEEDVLRLNQKQFFQALKENNWITNDYDNSYKIDCKPFFDELEDNAEYQQRKKAIEIVTANKKSTLEAEISELEKEKAQLKIPKNITEVIKFKQNKERIDIKTLFATHLNADTEQEKADKKYAQYKAEYEKLSSSCYFPLLRMLIIQGYIDEYYSDYTGFFDTDGLSQNDTLFLRNINERINTEWELELKKPELVLKRLNADKANRFIEEYVLNYSLLDYILATNKTENLSQFITISCANIKFIECYLVRCYDLLLNKDERYTPDYLCLFIKELNQQDSLMWRQITTFNQILYLYLSFIHNHHEAVLNEMNEDGHLKKLIEDSPDFLFIDDKWNTIFNILDESNLSKITIAFKQLNNKFNKIEKSPPKLLEFIEKNDNYQPNYDNVKHILENLYAKQNFDSQIIQTLRALDNNSPIKSYSNNNLQNLVLSIIESDIATINDDQKTVFFILNHDEISSSVKKAYIYKLSTIITKLNNISDKGIWNALLEKQKIAYSAENIVHYFFKYELQHRAEREINEQLIQFINKNPQNITSDEADINNLISKADKLNLFFRKITVNSGINNSKYSMLISWFNGRYYEDFDYQNIDKEKISILIQHKAIGLGEKQDLAFIREYYPDNVLELITYNYESYIDKLKENSSLIDHNEIINLLSENLSLEQKISLLELTSKPISIKNTNYPVELQKKILEDNFTPEDLNYITSNHYYNSAKKEMKSIIKQLCVAYKAQIIEFDCICLGILTELLKDKTFPLVDKYTLLIQQIPQLSAEKTYNLLKNIEQNSSVESYFSTLFIAKNLRFANTDLNKKIIKELNKKFNFTYKEQDDCIIGYGREILIINSD